MSKEAILQEPEGIAFFSVKTGETFYGKLEPTISALINSSDMGINASRGQDFGWRLAAEWVNAVRDFQQDEDKMDTLAAKLRLEDGESPSTVQILNYLYGRQVRAYLQRLKEEEAPFADQYQKDIAAGSSSQKSVGQKAVRTPIISDDPVTEDVSADEGEDDGDTSLPTGSAEGSTTPSNPKPTPTSGNAKQK